MPKIYVKIVALADPFHTQFDETGVFLKADIVDNSIFLLRKNNFEWPFPRYNTDVHNNLVGKSGRKYMSGSYLPP